MNLHTASNEELRDWLIPSVYPRADYSKTSAGWFDHDACVYLSGHPIPNTLDAGNAAMPEGTAWYKLPRLRKSGGAGIEWVAVLLNGREVAIPATLDSKTDLLRLAALAHQAMDTKGGT